MDQVIYRCGDCEFDTANRRFTRDGQELLLEPKVYAVLAQLLMRPGQLLTREALLDSVWGHRFVTASTLNRVIALARRAFADDAEAPRFIQTVHGAGYRYVGPIEKSLTMAAEPRARFGPPPSARLPARLQTLIGRRQELDRIGTLLAEGRALTVLGAGGMGKTQCALAYAHEQAERYPDAVWFFDLAPLQRPEEWLQMLAVALSIGAAGERNLIDKVVHSLVDRHALLLLDNCDRVSVGVGAIVVEILRATEQLKVLATSQHQLNFVGERVLRMPPLGLPANKRPSGAAELSEVAAAPAVSLLLARIRDAQAEFILTEANAAPIVDICARLDGMPLALELAAARFALLSAAQVLERLDHRFQFLVGERAGRDQRHRNLLTLLDWSYKLLSPEEQKFLAWLGVFVQGWTVDAAIEVAAGFGKAPETVVLLTGLVDKSLVAVDQSFSPPRYRLLESVREFALEQLAAMGDERRARDAHLAHVLRMTEAARQDMLSGRMRERIAMLRPEQGNIESATEYAIGAGGDRQAALNISGSLTLYFKAHGNSILGQRLTARALDGAPTLRTPARAKALMSWGVNEVMMNKAAPAAALLEAVSIAQEIGDDWTAAYCSGNLALWLIHAGRAAETAEHLAAVERSAERLDDGILRGLAGLVRGWRYLAQGAAGAAIGALQQVRELGGDFHQHHFIDVYIGLAQFQLGEHASAANLWHESMRNGIAVGHIRGIAGSIEGCAYIAEQAGRPEQACRFLSAAAEIRRRTQMPLFSFWIAHNERANKALRAALGAARYDTAIRAGESLRPEDVINEAAATLREFAGGAASAAGLE